MALPILDGNQSATTLSTILAGGEHTPAHTVVSLGSTAISNITSAVSGSVVSISNLPATQTIAGTVTAKIDGIDPTVIGNGGSIIQSIPGPDQNAVRAVIWSVDTNSDIGQEVGPANPLPISGTVTANNPSGALTTRFGSVVTANLATLTSAVTNTSRKYLLVQNIATSTVTIGIGFAPTTTQGIQLTAGAGLTFDAFCPTGGVWWLSGVTSSNFCVIEG